MTEKVADSDSAHSPVKEEVIYGQTADSDLLADPDAGLSDEERAIIVRALGLDRTTNADRLCRIRNSCESWTFSSSHG